MSKNRRVRVDDERVELYLLPIQQAPQETASVTPAPEPAQPTPVDVEATTEKKEDNNNGTHNEKDDKNGDPEADDGTKVEENSPASLYSWVARTDAEMRVFIEDELAMRINKDFANVKLSDEQQKYLAGNIVQHIQVELDLNIERLATNNRPLDVDHLSDRISVLAFRFDRFLRSLKDTEDREYQQRKRAEKDEEDANMAVLKLVSEDLSETKLPPDLVDHMLKVGMEKHLKLIRKWMLGDAGVLGVTLSFKDLTVTRKIPIGSTIQVDEAAPKGLRKVESILRPRGPQTVWSATVNTLFGPCFALADRFSSHGPREKEVQLLKSLNGVIRPGRQTLLLGAPHSGKTQLLHALARITKTKGPIKVSGDVFYNGHHFTKVVPSNFCTVVEQVDVHIPMLTVRETLTFAFHCRTTSGLIRTTEMLEKSKMVLSRRVDLIMAILGLTRVADTIIGNEFIKGISGGEMRRVTLGEMLVFGTKVLLLDEISTGLDSAATFDITKSIRSLCRVFGVNSVVSLLQPPPETFDLFDDVILMSRGYIVYHGPRDQLRGHFEKLSLVAPGNMDFADYMIEASLNQRELLLEAYKKSEFYADCIECLNKDPAHLNAANASPNEPTIIQAEQTLLQSGKFSKPYLTLLRIVVARQGKVIGRNVPFIMARLVQNIIMGLLLGALFFHIPFQQYYLVAMLMYQTMALSAMSTMALIGDVQNVRNVFYKQSKQHFFPASIYVISDYVVGLPFSLMDAFLLGSISYFMAGLSVSTNGKPYFIFLVIFISFSVCSACIIRFFAYSAPMQSVAFSMAVFFNIFSMIFSGAIATPSVIPPYFIWIYWGFSPMAWAYRSVLQNQFYSEDYESMCESGCPNNLAGQCVNYCGTGSCVFPYPNETCGVYFLNARQVATDGYFLWLGAGMLWIYTVLFLLLSVFALNFIRYDGGNKSTLQEDTKAQVIAEGDVDGQAEHIIDPENPLAGKEDPFGDKFQPKPLVWTDLVYTIDVVSKSEGEDGHRKHVEHIDLLKHITGFAKPYEMTALMGSSGAGKTTLLDCLCYRKTMGRITGTIRLGKDAVIPELFKKEVGYVEQFGIHSSKATVRESLEFSATLRLGNDYTDDMRKHIVNQTIEILELKPIENSLVGQVSNDDGLSFEENKRLTIAVELVSNPSVLFADEPTSGLTSKEARITMKALARVAASGRPVVCTIHQPSLFIFSLFHRLLLLKRGGEVVYFGRLGKNAENLVRYFQSTPGVNPMPQGMNPAAWMLDVIGAGVGRGDNSSGFDFAELYRSSDLRQENDNELQDLMREQGADGSVLSAILTPNNTDGEGHTFQDEKTQLISQEYKDREEEAEQEGKVVVEVPKYRRSLRVQLHMLLKRNFTEYWRTPNFSLLRWILMLIISLVCGFTFFQQQMGTAAGTQSRVGVFNLLLLLTANYNSSTVVPFVFSRRSLFYREKASGMYAPFLHAVSLLSVEPPYIFVEVVISVVVFYFLVGMAQNAGAFFYYLFMIFFFVELATCLGIMWSSAVGNQGGASLVNILFIQLTVLFSGVAVPGNVMSSWLLGAYYFSPVRWAMEGLVASQFSLYTQVICDTTGTPYTWPNGTKPSPECPLGTNGEPFAFYLPDLEINACCTPSPNRPLSARAYVFTGMSYPDGVTIVPWLGGANGYQENWTGYDYLYVVLFGLIVRAIAIVLTQYVSHQKR